MDLELNGCAALVGGASTGMGLATARALAREGTNVSLFARRADVLQEVVTQINSECGAEQAHAIAGDAMDPAALEAAVRETTERYGRLDILVNNTGGPPAAGFDELGDDDWQTAFDLTLQSALRTTRHALPALRRSGRGRIVNITSSAVKEGAEGLLLTNSIRPAVIGWAKDISRVEAQHGITVNSIAPGYIDTDRLKYLYSLSDDPDEARRVDAEMIPARRFGTAAEIASAIVFLCSVPASYINGVTLLVDGGLARGLLS
jgi:3-oxoacyl-[acyl-carrier protein] reductase